MLDMTNCGLVSFSALTLLFLPPGVLQLERTVVEVSTERGWMEQLRVRLESDTNSVGAVTVTIGPGISTNTSVLLLLFLVTLMDGMLIAAWQVYLAPCVVLRGLNVRVCMVVA
jgi:hypothetical protein